MRRSRPVLYAAYRGDEFVCVGTLDELTRTLGMPADRVLARAVPSIQRQTDGTDNLYVTQVVMSADERNAYVGQACA